MSIILSILFILFVIRLTFGIIKLGFHMTIGFTGFFTLLFVGAIILALLLAIVGMVGKLLPVILIVGAIALVVRLVKKSREEQYYSYNDNN